MDGSLNFSVLSPSFHLYYFAAIIHFPIYFNSELGIMKPLTDINAGPAYWLLLKTGEKLIAYVLKNDLLTEKVYHAGDRLIFECEVQKSSLYIL